MSAAPATTELLTDRFGRRIDYLRVSLTDRCNFRCVYCMPAEGFPATPKAEHLSADEFVRLVRIAASLGIRKVRLTGGEPLLRKDIVEIVSELATIDDIEDLSCTTNGFLLAELAAPLLKAGLTRINISLDTLQADRFTAIARRGELQAVLDGVTAAEAAGLSPIKINCVLMRGINDDEVADFARLTLKQPLHVRFIELMPMRWNLDESASEFTSFSAHGGQGLLQLKQTRGDMLSDADMRKLYVPNEQAMELIECELGLLTPTEIRTNGPARTYKLEGALGTVGFISQISNDFCAKCNRIRLTHDGFLRPCLMSDGELDIRSSLRNGASDCELADLIRHVVEHKPERHYLHDGQRVTGRGMSQIGG